VVGENLASGNGILVFDPTKTSLQSARNNGSGVLQFLEVVTSCESLFVVKLLDKQDHCDINV
jgi:hypothetical protein